MLIDTHTHSSAISTCSLGTYDNIIDDSKAAGLDGIILTNHYSKHHMREGEDDVTFSKRYVEEYRLAREYGDKIGYTVFFGLEVTMKQHKNAHLLVFGVDEQFVLDNPSMHMYTQEELYKKVKAQGGAVIQAHPYRKKDKLLDTSLLDGVELSCHPKYEGTFKDKMVAIAESAGIILTCGGDYHADDYRPHCGVYIDDSIRDVKDFAKYLCTTDEIKLCIHEVGDKESYDFTFKRVKK